MAMKKMTPADKNKLKKTMKPLKESSDKAQLGAKKLGLKKANLDKMKKR